MKLSQAILVAHASYILITAVWPIIDIESFMLVTGPKVDIWLVKTVGALLIPVAISLICSVKHPSSRPTVFLGAGTAVSFIIIDVYYSLSEVISDIYLVDAAVEFAFLIGWGWIVYTSLIRQRY